MPRPDVTAAIPQEAGTADRDTAIGVVTTRLAEALAAQDVFFIASDEQRAEAVAIALQSAAPEAQIIHSPSTDALPGEAGTASPANVGRRVAALRAVRMAAAAVDRPRFAFITTAEAATRYYPPPQGFDPVPPSLTVGEAIDPDLIAENFKAIGYIPDDRVDEPGEIAVRGNVIDLYPADAPLPVRIDVKDGRIAAIRTYNPVTQLGAELLEHLEVGQVAEPATGPDPVTLFDHLLNVAVAVDSQAARHRDRFVALASELSTAPGKSGATIVTVGPEVWRDKLADRPLIDIANSDVKEVPRFVETKVPQRNFSRFANAVLSRGDRLVVAGAVRDLRFMRGRLAKLFGSEPTTAQGWSEIVASPPGAVSLLSMPVERGWESQGIAVVAAADLLGSRAVSDGDGVTAGDVLRGDLGDVHLGDVVIHEHFGMGVIAGLETMENSENGEVGDAIVLEYASGGRRLVPVDDAGRLWRYGADAEAVTLDKLDGSSWEKRRVAIDESIAESARGLTDLAAERASFKAASITPDVAAYERFSSGFPFTETLDQARAIALVREDLASGKPMDRLVVGDVGVGKTEVALRAAGLVALAGKQVVIAAPTTVLVRQHLELFRKRFAGTGLVVAGLSRLSTVAERRTVKSGIADGSIAVVVGTGAVAAKGVVYKDLGLVVIDEEQRFGAADKAKLRAMNPEGHVLTMTATPIPRTLQSALIGLQQVSVIATPPARRQPIRTSVGTFDPALVRTALLREKSRGGQSFVVVSRIEDMATMAEQLEALVPDLVVRQAHGKMPAAEIDEAMVAFAGGDGDVLLATNIVEAGLDVPRANTMIVWRADRFGLSQLHQLRGRVGRGGRRGQIMMLTDPQTPIRDATLKRLRTLEALDRLGAGFAISARDLDIRGAGDLLGDAQAGHMKLVGIDFYQYLLEAALRTARGEEVDTWHPQLRLGVIGRIPEDWIPELDVRVALYGRLSRLTEMRSLDAFEAELEDRFGSIPAPVMRLLSLARIRLAARAAEISKIDAGPAAIAFTPRPAFSYDTTETSLEEKDGRLLLRECIQDPEALLERVTDVLHLLTERD